MEIKYRKTKQVNTRLDPDLVREMKILALKLDKKDWEVIEEAIREHVKKHSKVLQTA